MNTDRRQFLHASLAAGALIAAGADARAIAASQGDKKAASKKLKVLILGGTGFIGPALVPLAQARGHEVTLFNRGKTNKDLFPDVEKIQGDRDPKKGEGIKGLEGRTWDVVFDDCGYYPRMVSASAELLAKNKLGHYVYVSSISCYAKNDVEGADESAELATMPDPTVEKMGDSYEFYGPLKALCEQAAEKAMPGKTTIVRPGYIVGPGDPTDRFTYWPVRFDKGGTILVPGAPTDPFQVIDVRDLAAFMLRLAENKTIGTFNACGPAKRLSWGETLEACKACSSKKDSIALKWLPVEKIMELKDDPMMKDVEFPIWAPYAGDSKGFHTWSNARGVAAGMTFRPITEICADTLAWWKTLPADRQKRMERQFSAEKEAEILKSLG
jgi:2'-hydroxyisoflavone reductase